MTYTPTDKVVDKLNNIETTIRVATLSMIFVFVVWTWFLITEVQELQDLHLTDTIEVVEDE